MRSCFCQYRSFSSALGIISLLVMGLLAERVWELVGLSSPQF